jgi:hypothetical protein
MIENPQPAWMPILLITLPGLAFAAFALNEAIFPRGDRSLSTIPAICIVIALLPAHILALACGSLTIGLALAWSALGTAGYAWIIRHRQEFYSAISMDRARRMRRLAIVALATLPIALPTILLNYSDEAYHHAIIAQLQNGVYPPRYGYEPSLPLKYHYAFDLAGAIVTGLLRVRLDHAIDLLSITLWPCTFLTLWRVGEYVGGKRAGLFVALAVCFSGGWPFLAQMAPPCPQCTLNGLQINPPFIHYFFQHPWSVGVPIFGLVVLQRASLSRLPNQTMGVAALTCSLAMLSLSEVVLFVTTVAALGLTEAWRLVRFGHRTSVAVLIGLGLSLVSAKLIGGFFASGDYPPAGGLFGTAFELRQFADFDAVLGQFQWNLASFGLVPILGSIGLLWARSEQVFLTILAVICLVLANFLVYEYSWDIVKFGMVSFIVLGIGAGITLTNLTQWANNFIRRTALTATIVALAGEGIVYPLIMLSSYNPSARSIFSAQSITPYFSRAYPVATDDARAVSFLRKNMAPWEIVYRTTEKAEPYAVWGGLATEQPWDMYASDSRDNDMYGLGQKKFETRKDLARISGNWLDRLLSEHVSWVVTDPENTAENAVLDCAEGQGRVSLAAQYGNIRVFHIH